MIEEKTICYKVTKIQKELEKMIATGSADITYMAGLLHQIRVDAQRMENGLKWRKSIMEEAGIEETYQKRKINSEEAMPGTVNELKNIRDSRKEKLDFEFIVKEKGKVIYDSPSFGGIIVTVERIEDIDEDGAIEGQTQRFYFGHDLTVWFAYSQLLQGIKEKTIPIMSAIRSAIEHKVFSDPKKKEFLLKRMNNEI